MKTNRIPVRVWLMAALAVLALAASACSTEAVGAESTLQPSDRYIHLQATEQDARRTLDQNEFPQATIDQYPEYFGEDGRLDGGGYYLFMTSDDEWRIGSYMFLPQEITFIQGDNVTMDIFGVRGSEHETVLIGPDGNTMESFNVKRGELHQISFTVDEPGHYKLICLTHQPTMTTNIHVLPNG